jgi:hypothetical protein
VSAYTEFQALAKRCNAVGHPLPPAQCREVAILHRFISRIQGLAGRMENISFDNLAVVLKQAIDSEAEDFAKGGRS